MWFKQAQIYRLSTSIPYQADDLANQLERLSFTPCLPSLATSHGWVSPIDEDEAPLVHAANGILMICLQFEEKILPATVVNQALIQRIKEIESTQCRKVSQKEKMSCKDDLIQTLLPRAFSKLLRIFAYIDTKRNWIIVGTIHAAKTEKFKNLLQKSLNGIQMQPFELRNATSIMSHWLANGDAPRPLFINKACVLQDQSQQNRIIRCQQQDLFAGAIKSLLKDGCAVKELALTWNEQIDFVLTDELTLRTIRFCDEVLQLSKEIYTETQAQQFDADFVIMTETLSKLFDQLLPLFEKGKTGTNDSAIDSVQNQPVLSPC